MTTWWKTRVWIVFHYIFRLRAVPAFPLEFVEPRKDNANAGARKPRQGKTAFPRVGILDVFPRLDETQEEKEGLLAVYLYFRIENEVV